MLDRVSGSRLAKAASGGGCSMNRGLRRHRPLVRSHRLKVDRREPHDGAAGPGARRGAAGVADPGARASRRRRVAAVAAPRVSAERRAPLRAPQRAAARRARVVLRFAMVGGMETVINTPRGDAASRSTVVASAEASSPEVSRGSPRHWAKGSSGLGRPTTAISIHPRACLRGARPPPLSPIPR